MEKTNYCVFLRSDSCYDLRKVFRKENSLLVSDNPETFVGTPDSILADIRQAFEDILSSPVIKLVDGVCVEAEIPLYKREDHSCSLCDDKNKGGWNYRIVRPLSGDEAECALHEVFYNGSGDVTGITVDPIDFICYLNEGPQGIIGSLDLANLDIHKYSVLNHPKDGEWGQWDGDERDDEEDLEELEDL